MPAHPLAALRHLLDRLSSSGKQARASAVPNDGQEGRVRDVEPTPGREIRSERSTEDGPVFAISGPKPGGPRSAQAAHMMATYLGARAEEMLDVLIQTLSQDMADEVVHALQTTREALSAEIAGIQESATDTQRESARMGRELMRTGATLQGVQVTLSDIGTVLQRLESAVRAEGHSARERELEIRQEIRSETLGDVLATLDGLEAALDEAHAVAHALTEVARQIDDPTVRRWWRAMGEASGTDRPLPIVPVSDVESWVRGLELTYRRLRDSLERRGVIAIEAAGLPFDPHLHEAVAVEACPPGQDGIVLREERLGYRAADRVIRLAQVVVGKAELPVDRNVRPLRESADASTSESTAEGEDEAGEGIIDD